MRGLEAQETLCSCIISKGKAWRNFLDAFVASEGLRTTGVVSNVVQRCIMQANTSHASYDGNAAAKLYQRNVSTL